MATKKQVTKRTEELGMTMVVDNEDHSCHVEAPKGKRIAGQGGVHYITHYGTGDAAYPMSTVYDEILDDISWGLEDCTDANCEICGDK